MTPVVVTLPNGMHIELWPHPERADVRVLRPPAADAFEALEALRRACASRPKPPVVDVNGQPRIPCVIELVAIEPSGEFLVQFETVAYHAFAPHDAIRVPLVGPAKRRS